jgi:hypothetical protein
LPDFCTCGAQLPEDALFCHKCGKPQRDIVAPEIQPATFVPDPVAAPPVEPRAPAPLSFRNPQVVRIALLVAVIGTLLSFLPYVNWLAAGYFAVFLYRRRTGIFLTMESGVRMGWITGVIMFIIMAVLLSLSIVFFRAAGGIEVFQSQFKNAIDPKVVETLKMLQNGADLARLLIQLFVFTTLLSMAGGALGAKIARRH